jgi:carotenoid cleavage dioxygenase-like enzyme
MYSRTYVRARGFAAEEAAGGKQLFSGTLVAPRGWPMLAALVRNAASGTGMVLKDTANTALSLHGGKLLALMEQSRPSELSLSRGGALRTLAASSDLDGAVPFAPVTGGSLSAHSRVDPRTGEKVVLTYSTSARPFVRHDVFAKDGRLRLSEGVDLRAPVMVHDLAITANHTIVLDFPMTARCSTSFPWSTSRGTAPASAWSRAPHRRACRAVRRQQRWRAAWSGWTCPPAWCSIQPTRTCGPRTGASL